MRSVVVLSLIGLLILPSIAFAGGGAQSPPTTTAADAGKELGSVINARFELVDPRTGERGQTVVIDRFKASPMWDGEVTAGRLPSVDQRLPQEPLVIKPIESIGRYGGELVHYRTPAHLSRRQNFFVLEHLVTWTMPYFETLNPNVAKGWEVSADARSTTFYLRKGMKWSDGAPFTADDIVFWFEHIIKNTDLTPTPPGFVSTNGVLGTVTKIDETTVRFSFADPSPTFIQIAARIRPLPYAPAHYLSRFHPDFVSKEEIDRLVKEGGHDTWTRMFRDKANLPGSIDVTVTNPECPTTGAWIPLNKASDEVQRWRRNPYYWKVDTEGNQLPYIDTMQHPIVQDPQAWLLLVMAGEASFAGGRDIGVKNRPLLLENAQRGDYRLVPSFWPPNTDGTVHFNFTHNDPVKAALFNDRRFRLALLKAIDYDEVNDVVYEGYAQPGWPQHINHFGRTHEVYTRYMGRDVAQANALLDEIGLTRRDREGYRLGPDGKELSLVTFVSSDRKPEHPEVAEFYRRYWQEIGIRAVLRVTSDALAGQAVTAGEYDLRVNWIAPMGGGPLNVFDFPVLFPINTGWGINRFWAQWLTTDGKEGVEPPSFVKRMRELYVRAVVEPSDKARDAYIEEAIELFIDNLLMLPGMAEPEFYQFHVAKNNLRNFNIEGEPHGSEHHITPAATYYFR